MIRLSIMMYLVLLCSLHLEAQFVWKFEQSKGAIIKEEKTGSTLNFISNLKAPEYVTAVNGTGLRTDGYSTWLDGKLPAGMKGSGSVTGWFALESLPTDTAGFFALSNSKTKNWISACIDQFGTPLIGISYHDSVFYVGAYKKLSRFAWLHVCLSLDSNKANLIVNGELLQSISLPASGFMTGLDRIRIGRDERMKTIDIFPVTAINGIIDEVTVWQHALTPAHIAKLDIQSAMTKTPDLSIPESRFKKDCNRPAYHLLPAANWTNETHGLIYYNGKYHLFNQKNASNVFLGQINWGHFSSPDLVQWTEHQPILAPEPGYDQRGIWSGHCILDENGKPVIMYTGGGEKENGMCLAFPMDSELIQWEKFPGNPVVKEHPKGFARTDQRDPYLWKDDNAWYMIVGYGVVENEVEKGTLLLYKSTDLKNWQFVHTLFTGDPANDDSGVFWEMPVFWKMNGKYILLVNKVPYKGKPAVALYWTGDFKDEKFIPDDKMPKRLEVVNRLLSPSVTHDAEGRTTAIAIIPDETSAKAQFRQGWTHVYSIPRVWKLADRAIIQQPHPALEQLRANKTSFEKQVVKEGAPLLLSKSKHQIEIKAELMPQDCKRFGFIVGKNPKGDELTKIFYDFEKQEIVIDQTQSSKKEHIPLETRTGKYSIAPHEKVTFHLFIDGSVVEVFINNKDAFTTRIFPEYSSSNEVEVFAEQGSLQMIKAEVWQQKRSHNKSVAAVQ